MESGIDRGQDYTQDYYNYDQGWAQISLIGLQWILVFCLSVSK